MCGVNGVVAYHGDAPRPDPSEVVATRDAMATRGPDGSGLWSSAEGRCILGHRRLAILDLSDRGAQPMVSGDGRYVIVFNGEIYNYPALRQQALDAGRVLRSQSDTEILLDLYARRGPDMLQELQGMFAFAIWDCRDETLFLARDAFGIKPLYYADDGRTFRFASQVKALRAGGATSDEIDPAGAAGFLMLGSVPEPFTWYKAIRSVPAGHCGLLSKAGFSLRRYVSPASILRDGQMEALPHQDAYDRARAALRESVSRHLLSDVPVGLFLSGGIDSAALLGIAMETAREPIHAITLGFDEFADKADDEVPVAARVASHYGARHHVRRVARDEFLADLPEILAAMDQPTIDGINTWFVAKAAREKGLKVALSGIGGDEMLGGYPSFADVPRWHRRYGPLARIPGLAALSEGLSRLVMPGFVATNPKALGLLRHTATLGGAYLVRRGLRLPGDLAALCDPDFIAKGLATLNIVPRINETLDPTPGNDGAAVTLLEASFYMRNQLLRDADWAGMAHSIEIRTPLVDIGLFRALSPMIGHLAPGKGKQLLAEAPASALPNWHRTRQKTGFSIPYGSWLSSVTGMAGRPEDAAGISGATSRRWSLHIAERNGLQISR